MRRLVASEYVSLDGVFEEPGRWSFPFFSPDCGEFKDRELRSADALLLGRLTYEGFAKAWPTMEGTGDYGVKFNSMTKYLVSSTETDPRWSGTVNVKVDDIAGLKEQEGDDILLMGSGQLLRELLRRGLVDQVDLMLHPVVVGKGKKLFVDDVAGSFELSGIQQMDSGVTVQTYIPKKAYSPQ